MLEAMEESIAPTLTVSIRGRLCGKNPDRHKEHLQRSGEGTRSRLRRSLSSFLFWCNSCAFAKGLH